MRLAERAGNPILRAQAMLFLVFKHLGYDGELATLGPILDEIVETARANQPQAAALRRPR